MATVKEIIQASKKTDEALSKIQSDHIQAVQKSMEILNKKLIDASKMLQTNGEGILVSDKVAFLQAQKLHSKIETLYATEFTDKMRQEIASLHQVRETITTNLSDLGEAVKFTSIDDKMMQALQDSYYADFVSLSDTNKNKVVQQMYNQVIAGSHYSELVDTITNAVIGLKSVTGRPLSQYSTLYARDMVMNYHNSVMLKKGEDADFDTFLYMGTVMKSSRQFCIERVGKAYTKEQINSWTFSWAGKSGPAMTNRGGYNCRHHWQPVRSSWLTDEQKIELQEQVREPLKQVKQEEEEPDIYFRRPSIKLVEGHMNSIYASEEYKSLSQNYEDAVKKHRIQKGIYDKAGLDLKTYNAGKKVDATEFLDPKDPVRKKLFDAAVKEGELISLLRKEEENAKKIFEQYTADQFNSFIRPNETSKIEFKLPADQLSGSERVAKLQRNLFNGMVTDLEKMFHSKVVKEVPTNTIIFKEHSRAYCDYTNKKISLGSLTDTKTLIHEYTHAVEINYPLAREAAFDFRDKRVGNEKKSVIYKGANGRPDEMGWKDEFFSHYCGKDYGNSCTEILSMGVERMYTDPMVFFKEDPEYFDLCLKVMWGDLS